MTKRIVAGIAVAAALAICAYGLFRFDDLARWAQPHWKPVYLIYSLLIPAALLGGIQFFVARSKGEFSAQAAASGWGMISFALLLLFFLGASRDRIEFLRLFGFGAAGAALGYLTGIWLAPASTAEENRFAKAQSVVASVLAGAVGTKLLSLWDALSSPNNLRILDPAYHLPVLAAVVSYLIGLAAFYTLRTMGDGNVRVTAHPPLLDWIGTDQKRRSNGVLEETDVQFSGYADFTDDVSVDWDLRPREHVSVLPSGAGLSPSGKLKVPPGTWLSDPQNSAHKNWVVVATSRRDRSKTLEVPVHFTSKTELPPA